MSKELEALQEIIEVDDLSEIQGKDLVSSLREKGKA